MKPAMPSVPHLKSAALVLATAALAACGSAPIQFYTLIRPAATPATASGLRIEVLPVSVPPQVDVPQLVVRQSDSRIALVEDQQWIAPLGDEIRAALAAELSARLGAQDFSGAPPGAGLQAYRIKFDVRRFESALDGGARIEAVWSIRKPQAEKFLAVCSSRAEQSGDDDDYPALVEAHQRALQQIAAQIAEVLRAAHAGTAVACPS